MTGLRLTPSLTHRYDVTLWPTPTPRLSNDQVPSDGESRPAWRSYADHLTTWTSVASVGR